MILNVFYVDIFSAVISYGQLFNCQQSHQTFCILILDLKHDQVITEILIRYWFTSPVATQMKIETSVLFFSMALSFKHITVYCTSCTQHNHAIKFLFPSACVLLMCVMSSYSLFLNYCVITFSESPIFPPLSFFLPHTDLLIFTSPSAISVV